MAETTLSVNKESVLTFLRRGGETRFVIPEYQRPYAWTEDEIRTLFDDLKDFTKKRIEENEKETYFLGCIVSYKNQNNELEIIDGQQRITTLMLLLRAIYAKLENSDTNEKEVANFINLINPALWSVDPYTGDVEKKDILLKSNVINNDGNEILKNILETGIADSNKKDNYSKNYIILQKLLDEYSQNEPLAIYKFIYSILNSCIILPIQTETLDTALTIFSTLNNRGLPLSDADIFKAKIYNSLPVNDKDAFIEAWKNLEERADNNGESIQKLFYYYMFYLRAKKNDSASTTPGVRNYFLKTEILELLDSDLLIKLNDILDIMSIVNRGQVDTIQNINRESLLLLDILASYPNEFWKYPVINYFLSNKTKDGFAINFTIFLKKLISNLTPLYVTTPTINAVKSDILKLNIQAVRGTCPNFSFKQVDKEELKTKIKNPNKNIVRMLLKILAYNEQKDLLPEKWEVEHILPQKYQSTYFTNVSDEIIKETIEHIGNKVPFEKKLNIIASNGYFLKKKEQYAQSNIIIVNNLADISTSDWKLDNIYERDVEVMTELIKKFNDWNNLNYYDSQTNIEQPTQEELKLIEEFRKKGFIN